MRSNKASASNTIGKSEMKKAALNVKNKLKQTEHNPPRRQSENKQQQLILNKSEKLKTVFVKSWKQLNTRADCLLC